uniref:Uncharacterized protein n=1 Tax=Rhizophora mucronata TaxID=61149 RepID=A0A2P2MM12_RHIMU
MIFSCLTTMFKRESMTL